MLKISGEPEPPKEGGVFKIYDEPGIAESGRVFKIYDEPLAPKEGACLRYMVNRYRRMRARVKDIWRSGIAE